MSNAFEWVNGKVNWKVLHISHDDLDGAGCSIVVNNIFNEVDTHYVNYFDKLEAWIKSIEMNPFQLKKYDFMMITDVSLKPEQLKRIFTAMAVSDYNGKFVFLDHHESSKLIYNPKANVIVVEGVSGAKLTMTYLEGLFETQLYRLYEFINLVNDYDLWLHKGPESMYIQYLFEHHTKTGKKADGIKEFVEKYHNGICIKDISESEKNIINKKLAALEECWNTLDVSLYNNSKIAITFIEKNMFNELCQRLLDSPEAGIEVVINYPPGNTSGSIRASTKKIPNINIAKVLEALSKGSKVMEGGGHKVAAGFIVKDATYKQSSAEKFQYVMPVIEKICNGLITVYPELK